MRAADLFRNLTPLAHLSRSLLIAGVSASSHQAAAQTSDPIPQLEAALDTLATSARATERQFSDLVDLRASSKSMIDSYIASFDSLTPQLTSDAQSIGATCRQAQTSITSLEQAAATLEDTLVQLRAKVLWAATASQQPPCDSMTRSRIELTIRRYEPMLSGLTEAAAGQQVTAQEIQSLLATAMRARESAASYAKVAKRDRLDHETVIGVLDTMIGKSRTIAQTVAHFQTLKKGLLTELNDAAALQKKENPAAYTRARPKYVELRGKVNATQLTLPQSQDWNLDALNAQRTQLYKGLRSRRASTKIIRAAGRDCPKDTSGESIAAFTVRVQEFTTLIENVKQHLTQCH